MVKSNLKRYFVFLVGLYFLSFGIVFILKSGLGTTPISSLNYVLSLNTPLSLGICTFLFNLVLIAMQLWLVSGQPQEKKKRIEVLLQIPFSFVFGSFIDMNMYLCRSVVPTNYGISIVILLIGCLIQSAGVVLEVKPNVVMMSAEGFVKYSADRLHKSFGSVKVWFDVILVLLAVITSFLLSGHIDGVREGTFIAALLTGNIVAFLARYIFIRKHFYRVKHIILRS